MVQSVSETLSSQKHFGMMCSLFYDIGTASASDGTPTHFMVERVQERGRFARCCDARVGITCQLQTLLGIDD